MCNLFRDLGLILCVVAFLGPSAWAVPPNRYLPEGTGVIDGRAAVVVLPRGYDTGTTSYLDPSGLEVHLTPLDDPDEDFTYPAGSWFQPPPGRYRIWLQGGWRMTPFSALLQYSGQAAEEYIAFGLPTGEAGQVTLPASLEAAPNLDLHLLSAVSYLEEGFARWEISPRRPTTEIGSGVLLPTGKAVGLLWDRKRHAYVALSRPFEVPAEATVEVPLATPGVGADLVVEVKRRLMADKALDLEIELVLRQECAERPPDLSVLTADRVYAFWYGLVPGEAELTGGSEQDYLESRDLQLLAGKVEHLTAELKERPALDVQLELPATLRHEALGLEVRRLPTGEALDRRSLKVLTSRQRFERLPPALLEVELQTAIGAFSRQVDLSSGKDGFLLLKPELITVSGTVYHGDEGRPAMLTFSTAGRTIQARSGEDGLYEADFLEPVQTVSIALDGVDRTPYFDFFRPTLSRSKELNFHLADGDFRVSVVDADTGKGIPGAAVNLRNTFFQDRGRDEDEAPQGTSTGKNERAVFQTATANDTGVVLLPPLREGTLEIRASAKGYAEQRDPLKVQILDDGAEQTFSVRLDPVHDKVEIQLRLPTGAPAVGAELMLLDSLQAGKSLFSARADAQGLVTLPRQQPGFLLIKHPAAAFLVRTWRPEDEELELMLPSSADRPLRVWVRNESGEGVAANAELVLWVDGHRISGAVLAWLAGSSPMADSNGVWIGRNLPRTALKVLARSPRRSGAEGPDSEGVAVEYPWKDVVEVRAAD
ncbi:MAG: carboxypeptidase-like regulatory domain-containing protein [Acidobacteriota bacterium]